MSRAPVFVLVAVACVSCQRKETTSGDAGAGATMSASAVPRDSEAREVAAVLRASYPLVCATALHDWAECHDDLKGFANVRACYAKKLAAASAAKARKPTLTPNTPCGQKVARATLDYIDGAERLLTDTIAWLDANRAMLTPKLATNVLTDACESGCESKGLPSRSDHEYAAADFGRVQDVANACTQVLFTCEGSADCPTSKAVARLGIACDTSENVASKLRARSTGAPME